MNSNVIHVLPQPRTIPKGVIWAIYAIVAVSLIAAIVTVLNTNGESKSKKREQTRMQEQTIKPMFEARMTLQGYKIVSEPTTNTDYQESTDDLNLLPKVHLPKYKNKLKAEFKKCDDAMCLCDECKCEETKPDEELSQRFGPNEVPALNLVTLEEIVAYESLYRPRIRNLSWFEGSSDEVIDWLSSQEVSITNVMEISTQPDGNHDNCSEFEDLRTKPNEGHAQDEASKSDEQLMQNEMTKSDEQGAKEIVAKNDGGKQEEFSDETRERPRRHVATLHGCHGENYGTEDMRCRFVVRVLSTMLDDEKMDFAKNLAAQFWTVAHDRPGVYGFGHEVPSDPEEIKRHVHRCRYVIRIPLNSSDTTCLIKAQEEYEYLWNVQQGVNQPKYTITTTESCPDYELTWTNEYEFDSAKQANLHLVYQLSTGFFNWPTRSLRRPKRAGKRKIGNNKTSRCVGAMAKGSEDARAAATEARQTGDCRGFWRSLSRGTRSDRREYEFKKRATRCATGATAEAKFDCQFSDLIGAQSFVEKPLIEYERIGKTDWIVHTISQWNEELEANILSLSMSNGSKLLADLKEAHRLDTAYEWIPVAGKDYRPLVANDIFVTHLVATRLVSVEEATAYYIGAPVANLSRRIFFRTKIDVPPLEYSTLEPAECMTCPGVPMSPTSPNEGGREVSSVDQRPQCIYSEVLMSNSREKYILKCWGPDFPWVSIVATCPNLVTSQLEIMVEQRKYLESKVQPLRREFSSFVGGAARVHLPPDLTDESGQCRRRPRLVLVINDAMFDQFVDAEYDLSLTTYLTTVKAFAVLYVDPRANFFDAVDASKMKMQERESEQLSEYLRMVHETVKLNPCINICKGIGLLGRDYGAHLVLKFVADDWHSSRFHCSAAVRPFAPWQRYVYPFHDELTEYFGKSKLQRKVTRDISPFEGYMEQLVSQLPGKNLFLYVGNPSDPQLSPYASLLQSLAERYELSLYYHDSRMKSEYELKLKLYEALVKYFEDCFADDQHT